MWERHEWTSAQLRALRELIDRHPLEDASTDTFANPAKQGLMSVWIGGESYVIHEDGRILDTVDGELVTA